MKAVGGEIGSASALAPKLGPLGLVSFYIFIEFIVLTTTILFASILLIWFIVTQEGRWRYPKGHYGVEGYQSDG